MKSPDQVQALAILDSSEHIVADLELIHCATMHACQSGNNVMLDAVFTKQRVVFDTAGPIASFLPVKPVLLNSVSALDLADIEERRYRSPEHHLTEREHASLQAATFDPDDITNVQLRTMIATKLLQSCGVAIIYGEPEGIQTTMWFYDELRELNRSDMQHRSR